ncbi:hypothetical protein OSTOST_19039, partial [Ostertagia ostertagi]
MAPTDSNSVAMSTKGTGAAGGHFSLRENITTNMKTCYDAGMENFIFEVVTDKAIHLPPQPRVREVVVPTSY